MLLPASVTDQHGNPIGGLSASDFLLYDNAVLRPVRVDTSDEVAVPFRLVVAIQTSDISQAALEKIRKVGVMIEMAVAGERGRVAVIEFDECVRVVQPFTTDGDAIARTFRELRPSNNMGGCMLDAVDTAIDLLSRNEGRLANILLISESRDRGSRCKLPDVVSAAQHAGVTLYSITYSAYLTPLTTKAGEYVPPRGGEPNYILFITEALRLAKANTVEVLVNGTGGRRMGFATQSKLEKALLALGSEMHGRYILSFTPPMEKEASFHRLELKLRQRTDVVIRAKPGYWTVPPASSESGEYSSGDKTPLGSPKTSQR